MNKEQKARGRALRDKVPRESHAGWEAPKNRRALLRMLRENDKGRLKELLPIRYARMAESTFGFYRGSPSIMAEDLAKTPSTGIIVQACGDAHLKNFGGFATPERNVLFDLNDFDETLPAPWEWDLKRLAASFVVASRQNGHRNRDAMRCTRAAVRSYREHMAQYAEMSPLEIWYDKILDSDVIAGVPEKHRQRVLDRIAKERAKRGHDELYPKLVTEEHGEPRIKDAPPLIIHLKQQQRSEEAGSLKAALREYRDSLQPHVRALLDRYEYRDMAMKVVGVGSVGTLCMVMLFTAADGSPLFLQVKEARASVLEPFAGKARQKSHGQRVVEGMRVMQAATDLFVGYAHGELVKRDFYVRQLRDVKITPLVETFDEELMLVYADVCGRALARAHARTCVPSLLAGYMGSSRIFDDAIAAFAKAYADQAERDHAALLDLVREGEIHTTPE